MTTTTFCDRRSSPRRRPPNAERCAESGSDCQNSDHTHSVPANDQVNARCSKVRPKPVFRDTTLTTPRQAAPKCPSACALHRVEHGPVRETCLLYTSPSPRDGLLSRM